ncbi:unnamed protein product [Meganyctiphanes norvegica]|uniref:Uncharacterized protein n=1 Tax=Meganyctiphanes norvegica TaxID=48144 RepID=A0AAV2PXY2_MEGNR
MPGNRFIDPSILMLKGFDVLKLLNWNVTTNTYDMYFQYNFKYTSGAVGLGNNFLAVCSYRQPTDALQDDIFMPKYFNTSVILDQYTSGNDMKFGHIYNIEDGFPKVVSSFPVNGCVDIFAFTINDRQCIAPLNFRSDIVTIICYNEVFSTFEYFTTLQVKQPYQAKWISYSKFTYIFVGSMAIIDNGISTLNIFKINENGESVLQNKIEMKVVQFEFSVLQLDSQHHDLLVVLQKASRVANAFIRICHLTYDENGIISVAEIKDLHHDLLSSATRLSLTVTIDKRPLIVVETSTMIVFFTGTPMGTDFRLHSKIHLSAGRTTNMEAFVDETTKKIHVASSFIGTSQYDYYSFMDDKTVSSSYIYSSIYRPDFVFEEDADIFK